MAAGTALVIIPTIAQAANSLVRTADPTNHRLAVAVGSAGRTEHLGQGIRRTLPLVRRDSRSVWARAASRRG